MKIEARGKYAGVKVHLDGDEAEVFLDFIKAKGEGEKIQKRIEKFAFKLGGKIEALLEEKPYLLKDRTEEQIEAALTSDAEKIEAQLKVLKKGGDWKKV